MDLAAPAPKVEPAVASSVASTEPALADQAQQSEPPHVLAALPVEPAIAGYDESPRNVQAQNSKPAPLSVEALRGDRGSDFEAYAAVLRGAPPKNLLKTYFPCCFDERDFITFGEAKRYVIIKGPSCFIYGEQHDPSPLYAIPLEEVYAVQEDPNQLDPASVTVSPRPGDHSSPSEYSTVLLKYKTNHTQAYQLTFDTRTCDRGVAKRFLDVVQSAGTVCAATGKLTQSVVHAQKIGKEAMKAQPEI